MAKQESGSPTLTDAVKQQQGQLSLTSKNLRASEAFAAMKYGFFELNYFFRRLNAASPVRKDFRDDGKLCRLSGSIGQPQVSSSEGCGLPQFAGLDAIDVNPGWRKRRT